MQHLEKNILSKYVSGDMPERELSYCQRHLVECDACRRELAFLVRILDADVSPEELAILDSVETTAPAPFRRPAQPPNMYERFLQWISPGWKLAAVSVTMIMIVAVTWTVLFNDGHGTGVQVARSERTFEARLAGQPYSEFVRIRSGSVTDNTPSGNDELKRLGASHIDMGRFYLQHSEFAKAIAQLQDAEKQQPASVEICNDLGVAYMENAGDSSLEKALSQFQRALQLNPRYEPAVFNLALAYERLGYFREAEQQLKLYLQIDSDSDWAKEVTSKLQVWKH